MGEIGGLQVASVHHHLEISDSFKVGGRMGWGAGWDEGTRIGGGSCHTGSRFGGKRDGEGIGWGLDCWAVCSCFHFHRHRPETTMCGSPQFTLCGSCA